MATFAKDSTLIARAYHWASLGSHEGFEIDISEFAELLPLITSLDQRSNIVIMAIDSRKGICRSVGLRVTRQVTEFQFREKKSKKSLREETSRTLHNSLIDCHADVWTRFPVLPAVQRQVLDDDERRRAHSLSFIVTLDSGDLQSYFYGLISSFEKSTKKPTGVVLKNIQIAAQSFETFMASSAAGEHWQGVSSFKAGQWMVEIFCLIPIHIAIARDNRFVPLKNGVSSSEYEKDLLGAEVGRIVDSLTFGWWYESIFQSYLSTKASFSLILSALVCLLL